MNWSDYFYYDESSPSCLRWNYTAWAGSHRSILIHLKGDVAGGKDCDGYWKVNLMGLACRVHRVVWELHFGKVDDGLIVEHQNGDRADNRIVNLRQATYAVNSRNWKKFSNNTSGVTGVSKMVCKNPHREMWAAWWKDLSGKRKCKAFACKKYGEEEAFALACEHRKRMIEELNKQGAGYTERHGVDT